MTPRHSSAGEVVVIGSSRIPVLDGLRGVAISLVMLHHFTFYGGMRPDGVIDRSYYLVTMGGWVGVDLFFALSGFLITGILLDSKGSQHYFRNFYVRRALRIFPLYFGVLAVVFLLIPGLVSLPTSYQDLLSQQAWYWTYTSNWLIAAEGWPRSLFLGHFWSLAVEEQFYLLWPAIVLAFSGRQLMIACLTFVAGAAAFRIIAVQIELPLAAYVLTPGRLDALALGAAVASYARRPAGLATLVPLARKAAIGCGLAVLLAAIWRGKLDAEDPLVLTAGLTLIAICFAAIVAIAAGDTHSDQLSACLNWQPLRVMGKYSYALYAFHMPITLLLTYNVINVNAFPTWLGSQLFGQLIFNVAAGGSSLALAILSWHLYEARCLRLKARFPYGIADDRLAGERHLEKREAAVASTS